MLVDALRKRFEKEKGDGVPYVLFQDQLRQSPPPTVQQTV